MKSAQVGETLLGKFYSQIPEVRIFLELFFFFPLRLVMTQDDVKGTGAALATPREAKPIPASQILLGSGWDTLLSPQQVTQGGHSPAAGRADFSQPHGTKANSG